MDDETGDINKHLMLLSPLTVTVTVKVVRQLKVGY